MRLNTNPKCPPLQPPQVMTDARRRQEAEKERGPQPKGLDRLGGLSRIKVGGWSGSAALCLGFSFINDSSTCHLHLDGTHPAGEPGVACHSVNE